MRDLIVILATFLTAVILATFMALPAWRWVEAGRQEWQFFAALIWAIACYVLCGWAAMKALEAYRRH